MQTLAKVGLSFLLIAVFAFFFAFLLFPDPDTVESCTLATCDSLYAERGLSIIVFGVSAGFALFGFMFAVVGFGSSEEPVLAEQ